MKRGTRNNNPGNIKYSSLNWRGKVPKSANTDARNRDGNPTFEQFQSMEYGIRALYRLLVTYVNKYGLRSVSEIIDRYAPPGENSETARQNYKSFVTSESGTELIHNKRDLYSVARGIMIFETSKDDYDTYIQPYISTAMRITDLTDLSELQPIAVETPKKKIKPILSDIALAAFFINIFSKK